jgi:hypothetical protein
MQRLCLAIFTVLLALAGLHRIALADERVLQWDNGVADLFIHQEEMSHFVVFDAPAEWATTFPVEAMFYGKRYGDVGDIKGTVVVWGPQTEKTPQLAGRPNNMVIYSRQPFSLASVPEQPGWFTVPLTQLELPKHFAVSVFTFSTDERGVELGLTAETSAKSHSTSLKPEAITAEALAKLLARGKEVPGSIKLRDDGREWMLRIKVRPTLQQEEAFTSGQLTGDNYSYFDDGEAEGWLSVQKFGPMVHVTNSGKRTIDRVYVYAKAEGDWYNNDRAATVYILDSRYNIVSRAQLPYTRFTDIPSWGYVSLTKVKAPDEFYVLVAPNCRPKLSLLIGYDTSGANKASLFGTPGANLAWDIDAPYEKTNWMIRVKYK